MKAEIKSAVANPPEFTALVLACSVGTRLFPLTSSDYPKHLLPLVGVPILHRLVYALETAGFTQCVIAIQQDDAVTVPSLQKLTQEDHSKMSEQPPSHASSSTTDDELLAERDQLIAVIQRNVCTITVVRVNEDCTGSGEALRLINAMKQQPDDVPLLHPQSHIVVVPGDLVILDVMLLKQLLHEHREGHHSFSGKDDLETACTVLLTDVSEIDENGVPLKESSKHKKGGLSRDEEEIEYTALCHSRTASTTGPRLIWKQPKVDVEREVDMTGETAKLTLPKGRLGEGRVQVGVDWNDVHVYVFSPWIRHLVQARDSTILSLRDDLLPLLVSRQYKGVVATFGGSFPNDDTDFHHKLATCFQSSSFLRQSKVFCRGGDAGGATSIDADPSPTVESSPSDPTTQFPRHYAVRAAVKPSRIVRSHTVPAYLHANREFLILLTSETATSQSYLQLVPESQLNAKFQSVLLPGATVGDKVTFKSTVVGRGCKVGSKCRMNNVVLVDNVTVGDNATLQNTVVAWNATVSENCSLNDCQVGPNKSLPAGTKAKADSFIADDL